MDTTRKDLDPELLEIGEASRAAGVSPRMLRHWEEVELLVPASIDPVSGRRRYSPTQVERIGQIARRRAEGRDLARVRELLSPDLGREGLVGLLEQREAELEQEQRRATERLVQVRRRLDGLARAADQVATNARLVPRPATTLWGLSRAVHDEREIGAAVRELVEELGARLGCLPDVLVQVYDGRDPGVILVGVGIPDPPDGGALDEMVLPVDELAVDVVVDPGLVDEADLWVLVDDHLATKGQTTHGIHWRRSLSKGRLQLGAGVLPLGLEQGARDLS